MNSAELSDREAIRALMARYNINGDRGQTDALSETFAEDGTLEFSGAGSTGRQAIAGRLLPEAGITLPYRFVRHHLTTSLVELDADEAHARSYFLVYTDMGLDHHGVYIDWIVRIDGDWLFRHRKVRIDWQAPDSLFPPLHVRGNVADRPGEGGAHGETR